jgi:hypothetical protein
MVFTRFVTIGGSHGVQASVMTPLVISPTVEFFIENLVPYFQSPAQNPPSRFGNFGGRIPT